jgi:hypothetical protein
MREMRIRCAYWPIYIRYTYLSGYTTYIPVAAMILGKQHPIAYKASKGTVLLLQIGVCGY